MRDGAGRDEVRPSVFNGLSGGPHASVQSERESHADLLLIRGDVLATIAGVLARFDDRTLQQLSRGSYRDVLVSKGEEGFAVRQVNGWTIVVGAPLTIYGNDDKLEELARQLECEVFVASAVGTTGSYGFSRFDPTPKRQFLVSDDNVALDEGEPLAAESAIDPTSFGQSELMLVLARHATDLHVAWEFSDWEAWGAAAVTQPNSAGKLLRAKRRTRLAVPTEVTVDVEGWTRCPECNRRLKVSDASVFSNGVHKCGKHLAPIKG